MTEHEKRIREALEDCLDRIEKSEFWWMDCPDRGGFDAETIRAILALRPQAVIAKAQVPMTDEQIVGWLCEEAQHTCGQWQVVIESDNPSFIDAVREHAARAQGITAQGAQGGEG